VKNLRAAETTLIERCILNADASCDHGVQLHHLAKRACDADAPEDDLLVFLDSDAWPLASLKENVVPLLDAEDGIDLVAVRRSVEGMALWPHPSFAVTTCGAWTKNKHSFSQPPDGEDPEVVNERLTYAIFNESRGLLCHDHFMLDTGAPLWRHFNDSSKNWVALDRMNKLDIDPLFYGVYGLDGVPMAYHQGAGSRHTATSKVVPVADGSPDGYDDVAFKIDDMVLDLMGQPNGTEALIHLLLHPRSSPYFRANSMQSMAFNSTLGYTDTAAYARTLVDTCMELRFKLLKIADVKYDKVLKADVPHDCVFVGGKLQGSDGGECSPSASDDRRTSAPPSNHLISCTSPRRAAPPSRSGAASRTLRSAGAASATRGRRGAVTGAAARPGSRAPPGTCRRPSSAAKATPRTARPRATCASCATRSTARPRK